MGQSEQSSPSGRRSRSSRLSVIVVTWRSAGEVEAALAAVECELQSTDELIVIDNASDDGTPDVVAEHSERARIIRNTENRGFVAAVNQGARLAFNELLVLLNPDAVVEPGWREAITRPWSKRYGWGAWQGLITCEGGATLNSAGNQIHFTGICWAGRYGRPVDEAPRAPGEVGYASGACMVVPAALWHAIGGFPERLFMYGDDVDVCLRLRLLGYRIGIEPAARVVHDYEFDKGSAKWRYLERSRWALLIRNYPRRLLLGITPALVLTELALIPVAISGGWLGAKLLATTDVLRWLPQLLRERREIQASRRIGAKAFAAHLTPDLGSPFQGRASRSRLLRKALRWYWRRVLARL